MLRAEPAHAVARNRVSGIRLAACAIALGLLCIYPTFAGAYYTYLGGLTFIAVIGAVGSNLLTGYTGLVSFGAAAFLAIGGFSAAYVSVDLGWSYWLSLPLAAIVAGIVGIAVGVPSLRLRGLYLVLSTLALHYIVLYVCDRYQRQSGRIGGFTIAAPAIGPFHLRPTASHYFVPLIFAILALAYCANLLRTRVGRAFIAVRDRDSAAAILGVNVGRYKLAAFIVSSALLGVAGAVQALVIGSVTVENYNLLVAVDFIAMFVIGGTASLRGSVVGAAVVTLLPVVVRNGLDRLPTETGLFVYLERHVFDVNAAIFGVLIILFVRLEPGGLISLWDRFVAASRELYRKWAAADGEQPAR